MSRLTIDTGTPGNPATGDSLRGAFTKVNNNFAELYAELGGDSLDAISFTNNTISTDITNANLVLTGNGTGGVVMEDIEITGSTINVLTTNSNLTLDTNGTGKVIINGLSFPTADGTAGQVLKTDGAGNLSFTAVDAGAITFVGDDSTGTAVNTGETIRIAGSGTVTTSVSGDTITITGSASAQGITFVGDDSTGTRVSDGESFKIAGTQNITTAVSGDTLTITGPNLSSYLTNSTITVVGDDSTGTTLNTGETIMIAGGTGLTSVVSGDTITLDIDSTVTTLTGSQELTNKTLTTPKIDLIKDANGNEILSFSTTASATDYLVVKNGIGTGVPLHIYAEGDSANIGVHLQPKGSGIFTISDGIDFNKGIRFRSSSSAASAITLIDAVSTAGRVVTLPDATDTLVGRATTDTLTNKSISLTTNTITGTVITIVGDDSTGTAVNIGETFKIAGAGSVTTAVSGDTLTITGSKDINVNSITSSDSSAIQINDAVNISGAVTANAGLTVPGAINGLGNSKLDFNTYGANTAYLTTTSDDTTALFMGTASAELYAQTNILIRTNTDETAKVWTFGDDGSVTFPDSTTQNTAASITIVGDDSTGVTLNAGETIKIAGAGSITTAVSGDTITITGTGGGASIGDLTVDGTTISSGSSSKITLNESVDITGTLQVNDINSADSTAIQINDSVNISGTLNAKTLITNTISSEDSSAIQINDGLRISGDLTFSNNTVQTTAYVTASGNWTVTAGTNTYSFTIPSDGTYTMWVKGNIANGIIIWNATVSVSNSNVAAIGYQYAWNYTGGGSPISFTAIPDQIRGTAGTISTDATYAGSTSNRFDFGIANSSGASQTIYYGYAKIS